MPIASIFIGRSRWTGAPFKACCRTAILTLPFLLASCTVDRFIGEVNLVVGGQKTTVAGECGKYIEIPQSVKTHIANSQADATDDVGELETWLLWLHEDVRATMTAGCPSAPAASSPQAR